MSLPESTPLDDKARSSASTPSADANGNQLANQSTSRGVWGPFSNGRKSTTSSGGGQIATNGSNGERYALSTSTFINTAKNSSAAPKALTSVIPPDLKTTTFTSSTFPDSLSSSKGSNGFLPTTAASRQALPGSNAPSPLFQNHLRVGNAYRDGSRSGAQSTRSDLSNQTSDAPKGPQANGANNPTTIKMKRTGQNFPLNSSNSSHRRNGSNSPIIGPGSIPGGGGRGGGGGPPRRAPDIVPNNKVAAPTPIRETPVPIPRVPVLDGEGPPPLSSKQRVERPSKVVGPSRNGIRATHYSIPDSDSDDIMYEAAAPTDEVDTTGLVVDAAMDNASSSESSGSQSDDDEDDDDDDDDDETAEMDPAGELPIGQRFQAPDHEDDDDSEDETEDDDAASESSSSGDSSIANEPAVDLPSAGIQHQELFPSTILEMAEPGRPYSQFLDNGITVKAAPALFPAGYSKSTIPGFPWMCAVRSCRQCYQTPGGIANHARFTHKKAMFNDNMDGTVSLVGSYSQRNGAGQYPPVVVSRRPLDPKEPPMREPTLPVHKNSLVKTQWNTITPVANQISVKEDMDMVIDEADNLEPQAPPPRPQTADRESSAQMWWYIRPYLSVHKSIPELNWARYITHLPRVRDIAWNVERAKDHPYKDSHPRDVTALIVQVTGVESPTPCAQCAQGKGPFIGCIQVSPEASDAVKAAVLSCANCYYHCGQSACTLCRQQVARRKRESRSSKKHAKSYNMKLLTDLAHGKSSRAAAARSQAQSGPAISPIETSLKRNLKLYQPSEFSVIEMASSERAYTVIKKRDGGDERMHGALIPEKYDLDHTLAGYPWICSVRSCRKVFKKITSLGSHFIKAHPGSLLNDNLDGTLSQVGYYTVPRPGVNSLPALIISKNPLNPDEPPMEDPTRPGQQNQAPPVMKRRKIVTMKYNATKEQSVAHIERWKLSNSELWNHIRQWLPTTVLSVTADYRVLSLLNLPRQRNFQLRPGFKVEDDHHQIVAAICYVAGEENQNGARKCTLCAKVNGPFPHCIVLKKGVPSEAQSMVRSCANCIFTHQKGQCSIKGWQFELGASESAAPPIADLATVDASSGANKRLRIADSESEEPLALRRRSDRLDLMDGHARNDTEHQRNRIPLSLRYDGPPMPQINGLSRGGYSGGTARTGTSSALVQTGHFNSDDVLEMDDWEIRPGRLRATGASGPDNFAFSKSYLESNQAVRVSRDTTTQVKTIKSGNSLELAADPTSTRYCTLATGKVHVTITGAGGVGHVEEFSIGPLGMVKLVPGVAARLLNKLYIEVTLTILSVAAGD